MRKLCSEAKLERSSRRLDGLKNEIHSLYYEKGMTQREIARRFGVGEATVSRLFQENEWVSRNERRGVQMRVFENEEERKEARREHRRVTQRRIRELRNSLFGSDCEICGLDTKENKRVLCIHRKDGMEHRINALWRIKYLENLDREDWAPLCIPCHRGTHWLMENANKEWKNIESRKTLGINSSEENIKPLTREDYEGKQTEGRDSRFGRTAKEVRMSMFGRSCHFCGKIDEWKRIVIHRKDGRPHDNRILSSAKYLRNLDPTKWVALCNKCHRQVTWAKYTLGIGRDDLK